MNGKLILLNHDSKQSLLNLHQFKISNDANIILEFTANFQLQNSFISEETTDISFLIDIKEINGLIFILVDHKIMLLKCDNYDKLDIEKCLDVTDEVENFHCTDFELISDKLFLIRKERKSINNTDIKLEVIMRDQGGTLNSFSDTSHVCFLESSDDTQIFQNLNHFVEFEINKSTLHLKMTPISIIEKIDLRNEKHCETNKLCFECCCSNLQSLLHSLATQDYHNQKSVEHDLNLLSYIFSTIEKSDEVAEDMREICAKLSTRVEYLVSKSLHMPQECLMKVVEEIFIAIFLKDDIDFLVVFIPHPEFHDFMKLFLRNHLNVLKDLINITALAFQPGLIVDLIEIYLENNIKFDSNFSLENYFITYISKIFDSLSVDSIAKNLFSSFGLRFQKKEFFEDSYKKFLLFLKFFDMFQSCNKDFISFENFFNSKDIDSLLFSLFNEPKIYQNELFIDCIDELSIIYPKHKSYMKSYYSRSIERSLLDANLLPNLVRILEIIFGRKNSLIDVNNLSKIIKDKLTDLFEESENRIILENIGQLRLMIQKSPLEFKELLLFLNKMKESTLFLIGINETFKISLSMKGLLASDSTDSRAKMQNFILKSITKHCTENFSPNLLFSLSESLISLSQIFELDDKATQDMLINSLDNLLLSYNVEICQHILRYCHFILSNSTDKTTPIPKFISMLPPETLAYSLEQVVVHNRIKFDNHYSLDSINYSKGIVSFLAKFRPEKSQDLMNMINAVEFLHSKKIIIDSRLIFKKDMELIVDEILDFHHEIGSHKIIKLVTRLYEIFRNIEKSSSSSKLREELELESKKLIFVKSYHSNKLDLCYNIATDICLNNENVCLDYFSDLCNNLELYKKKKSNLNLIRLYSKFKSDAENFDYLPQHSDQNINGGSIVKKFYETKNSKKKYSLEDVLHTKDLVTIKNFLQTSLIPEFNDLFFEAILFSSIFNKLMGHNILKLHPLSKIDISLKDITASLDRKICKANNEKVERKSENADRKIAKLNLMRFCFFMFYLSWSKISIYFYNEIKF
ncbi:MAG: hypothetical protein MHMPM18_001735 [Marteilia pararefringens]